MIYLIAYLTIAAAFLVWMSRKETLRKTFKDGSKETSHVLVACIVLLSALIWPALWLIAITLRIFGVKPDEIEVGKFTND